MARSLGGKEHVPACDHAATTTYAIKNDMEETIGELNCDLFIFIRDIFSLLSVACTTYAMQQLERARSGI